MRFWLLTHQSPNPKLFAVELCSKTNMHQPAQTCLLLLLCCNGLQVSYEGSGQRGKHKPGKLVAGQLPKGTLCQPQSFSFTRQFGPYSKCGQTTARVSAGLLTAAGVARSQALLTTLDVTGCSGGSSSSSRGSKQGAAADTPVSSRMRLAKASRSSKATSKTSKLGGRHTTSAAVLSRADPPEKLAPGGCVYQPWFWKHCMLPDLPGEAACDVIVTSLPGGQGPRTPFFPYRKSPKIRRTYRQLLMMPKKTGNRIVDLHFYAAKAFIATQLNQYAGVAIPRLVRAAYLQLGREYFSVYDDRNAAELLPARPEVLQQVAAAAKVLADFTGGKLPGLPTCAAVKKQAKSQRRRPPSQKQQ